MKRQLDYDVYAIALCLVAVGNIVVVKRVGYANNYPLLHSPKCMDHYY